MQTVTDPVSTTRFPTERLFMEAYQNHATEPIALREAACLRAQNPAIMTPIQDGDLFAGRKEYALIGFTPQGPGFGYYCDQSTVARELANPQTTQEDHEFLMGLLQFWETEQTSAKVRAAYPADMACTLPSDNWTQDVGIGFPLYRMGGATLDYGKLLQLGIPGLRKEITRKIQTMMEVSSGATGLAEDFDAVSRNSWEHVGSDGDRNSLYDGMLMALDVLEDVCRHYAAEARSLVERCTEPKRRQELMTLETSLVTITERRPQSLHQAMQLFWLYTLVADVRNYGRMDVYLGNFLAHDLDTHVLSEFDALAYTESLWRLMAHRKTIFDGRVVIGGKGRPNSAQADRFAMIAIEATRRVLEVEPQLSLRWYDGMDPALLDASLAVLGEGRTFPILYNDEINVPAVMSGFGVTHAEAEQYVPLGCGEYLLANRSYSTPSGVINLVKALEAALHNGWERIQGKRIGIDTGQLEELSTFEDLVDAYQRQVEYRVHQLAQQEALEYQVAGETAPFLYLSMLYDDCIDRSEGIFSGGLQYLGGTLETYGNVNVADSLTAIRELVYRRQEITLKDLVTALDANFEGNPGLRNRLKQMPKFGNDHDESDEMLCRVHDHICKFTRSQAVSAGLDYYLVVVINNSANTILGHQTGASADGRLVGESMANGNAPSSGNDRMGITALLNSMVKADPTIHAGTTQNLKLAKELFREDRRHIVKDLLLPYFSQGGTQAMITVVDRQDLERAMAEPQKYAHIFVRVGGFSARFIDLPRDVQLDILQRTLYEG